MKLMNQTILVGRLVNNPELHETENGKSFCNLTIAVPRPYKNDKGEYDTDFIQCKLWQGIARNTSEYCKKGDLVGIKGRLQTIKKNNQFIPEVVAEKMTFLSNRSKDINEEVR